MLERGRFLIIDLWFDLFDYGFDLWFIIDKNFEERSHQNQIDFSFATC